MKGAMTAMPDSSLHGVALTGSSGSDLLDSLAPLLTRWLPGQRWFAGKGRPVDSLSLTSVTELLPCGTSATTPGLLHLLVTTHQGRSSDCYQLLLGVRPVLPPSLLPALVGLPDHGPLRGRAVYDAVPDPRLSAVLLERLRTPGRLGALRFKREPGAAIGSGLRPRPLLTEQSNSSVVYGDSLILKLFRRVSPGLNPDLELPLALARAGCREVPAPVAWFEAGDVAGGSAPLTLGILQPYLPDSTDGWQLALRALQDGAGFEGCAHALGRATAYVHTALARTLPTGVLAGSELAALADEMTLRLDQATEAVPALRPYHGGLREVFHSVVDLARRSRHLPVQRIHGDLHLGQALRTHHHGTSGSAGRWALIDFEGEPAKSLAERRTPQPILRDIAGMLRSFDYAAHSRGATDSSRAWAQANRTAYCAGYGEASGTDLREQNALLRVYETDKAVYEVLYEARHRPSWLPIPLAAIRRLALGTK